VNLSDEKVLKNTEVCELLGISDYERKQFIARGILDAPMDTGAAYPKHTVSQVYRAKARLTEGSAPRQRPASGKRTKPLTRKMASEIRGFR
jgi:hypothetical protein